MKNENHGVTRSFEDEEVSRRGGLVSRTILIPMGNRFCRREKSCVTRVTDAASSLAAGRNPVLPG